MAAPMRFTNGVTNVASTNTFGQFFEPDPTKVYSYFNDFFTYSATDWVATATSVGTGTSAAAMSDTEQGGAIVITNADADNDSFWLQLSHDGGTNDSETFKFVSGKKAWFKARFKIDDVTQSDCMFGLHITATDPIDTAPTDGVWFQSDDGDANLDFHIVKNSVYSTASAIATMSNSTYVTVGFYYDGVETFHYFVNDSEQGTLTNGTMPDDETLAISFGLQNGEAAAKAMAIDYIGAWMER